MRYPSPRGRRSCEARLGGSCGYQRSPCGSVPCARGSPGPDRQRDPPGSGSAVPEVRHAGVAPAHGGGFSRFACAKDLLGTIRLVHGGAKHVDPASASKSPVGSRSDPAWWTGKARPRPVIQRGELRAVKRPLRFCGKLTIQRLRHRECTMVEEAKRARSVAPRGLIPRGRTL